MSFREFRATKPDAPEHFAGVLPFIRAEKEHVALGKAHALGERLLFLLGEEFDDGRFPFAAGAPLDVGEPFGAELGLDPFLPFLELLLREEGRGAFGVERLDRAAAIGDGAEDLELRLAEDIGDIDHLHGKAGIRLIRTKTVHRLAVGHARKGRGNVDAARFLEDAREESLDERLDFVVGDERGFEIDLREFRLAIGAQIFVPIAARDLEIFLESGDLEQLLVLLRRLRERVERAGVEPRRHEEIARAFGRGIGKNRRLDFEVAALVEVIARRFHDAMAQLEIALHVGGAQVEVTVFEPEILVHFRVIEREGRHVGFVEHFELAGDDFDLAGLELRVLGSRQAGGDGAGDLDHVFAAQAVGGFRDLRDVPRAETRPG